MTKKAIQKALSHIMHDNYQKDCKWCKQKYTEKLKEARKQVRNYFGDNR